MDRGRGVWQHRGWEGDDRVEQRSRAAPHDADHHGPEYRTVAVYWTVPEAELARGLLESDGIPVAALDGADATLLPGTAPVRLLVPAHDLERSRLLLLEARGPASAPSEDAPSAEGCGFAGSAWSQLALGLVVLALLMAALLSWQG
jgi:hypothetical protein